MQCEGDNDHLFLGWRTCSLCERLKWPRSKFIA